jgi:hypothetical protein
MGVVRRGIYRPLEDEANRLLRESLEGVTRFAEKADILTPWKEQMRREREMTVPSGTPDRASRQGMYHRAYNPTHLHLNGRDGTLGPRRRIEGSLTRLLESGNDTSGMNGIADL